MLIVSPVLKNEASFSFLYRAESDITHNWKTTQIFFIVAYYTPEEPQHPFYI